MLNNELHLNPFAISNLLTAFTCIILSAILFLCGKTKLSFVYGLHTCCVALWGFGGFLSTSSVSSVSAFFWWKIAFSAVIFIPILFLHAIFILVSQRNILILLACYSAGVFFLVLNFNGVLFTDVMFMFDSFYYLRGKWPYLALFICWILAVVYGHYLLIRFIGEQKDKHYLLFVTSTIVGFLGGASNFLPGFGINLYPIASFLIPVYFVVISYAVLKHQILDINLIIQKSVVYSISVAIITAIYFMFILGIGQLFQGLIGSQSFLMNLFAVLMIAILFNPLREQVQRFIDRYFFQGTLESLAQEKQRLQQELYHKEKLAYIGQLASSVVHEIKNPLTAIKTFVDYLPQKYNDVDFREKFSRLIPGEVERIDRVVGQLLNLAKPRQVNLKPLNVLTVIDTTLALLQDNLTLKKISVQRDFSVNEAIINGDEEQLRQVFLNLFLNAIQAMDKGGTLTVEAKDYRPKTKAQKSDDPLVLSLESGVYQITITDTGCGISEESLKKLFTPFVTTKKDGIGLGLSISQEIILSHGGMIMAESKLGKGTKFTIELPRD
ncbi:MAG: ATP-binding protein [Candidatus Omnitrophota bacterium]